MPRQHMRKFNKYVFVLPLLLWMAFIFMFSSQPYEKQDLRPWLQTELSGKQIQRYFSDIHLNYGGHIVSIQALGIPGFVEFFIRKSAHITVYAVLGLLALICFSMLFAGKRGLLLITIAFCALYAMTDEYHQSFTANRTPMAADVVLDTAGAFVGALFYVFAVKGISFMYSKFNR